MGRGGAKPKLGEGGAGKKGDENLVERKKTLEQELKDVEERLAQQLVAKSDQAAGVAGKKGKKEKLVKAKKAKKGKAPKAHPSSKAGPGFSVILTDDNPPLVAIANINKKAHAYKKGGLREGDLLVRIDGQSVRDINLNEVKAKLVARCGTILKLDLERLAVEGAGEGSATFAEWLSSADSTQQKSYVGPYSAEVILEFGPLVKSIKSGKPFQRGQAAELSLQMANSQVKRELLFVAGALQPLCKLLTDPKAAAQFNSGIKSLQNMLRISLWDELSIALSAMGKPLVQMIEKGGLVKKMLAVDLLQRIALFAPTHRVLIASGVLEAVLAQPKGIIPVALPKQTPKGWKAGKKVTGLEAKAASLVGSLARMDDSTRTRINSTTNNGVELLVRMMQRKREPAGALNDITPEGSARALEALQYTSLNVGCRAVMDRCGALESIVATLEERMEEQRKGGSRRSRKQIADEVAVSFHKADFGGSGTLNAKEFEEWFVSGGRGDGRQAKAAFRECDADGSGQISLAEVIAFVTREKPEELVDLYSACCIRNLAVSSTLRERLQGCGATGLLVAMLERAAAAAEPDAARCLVALLALLNMSALTASAEEMRDLNAEHTVAAILCSSYSPPPPPRPPSRAPDPTSAIASEGVLPERAAECDEVACAAALLLRRLVVLRTCKARLVAADVEAASTRGQGGGERLTLIGTLCSMVREGPVCSGVDAVGNEIVCHGASAAVAALQNLLAEHAIARALAIQAGVIDSLKCLLWRWIDRMQRMNPPELPSEGEDSSDDEEGEEEGEEKGDGGTASFAQPAAQRRVRVAAGDRGEEDRGAHAVGVGKALVLVLGAGGDVERGVGDREEHEEAGAAKAVGGVCDGGVDGKSVVEQRRSENKEGVFEALPSEVTWTAEWWQEQEELDACRAAWCIHCLAFDDRDLLLEEDVDALLRRAVLLANDSDTNTACTWALLQLQ